MANKLFPSYKETVLTTGINLSSSDIRVILIDGADYTQSDAHDNLDDVAAGARVATSDALASKTTTNGTFDAADKIWSSVTGDESEEIIGYFHSGVESTSDLIFFFDTSITGAPVTPNGGDITCTFNASGIFSI